MRYNYSAVPKLGSFCNTNVNSVEPRNSILNKFIKGKPSKSQADGESANSFKGCRYRNAWGKVWEPLQ